MAVPRYNRYQYETSPRKLEPEYSPVTKKYPKKSVTPRNRNKTKNRKSSWIFWARKVYSNRCI